MPPENFTSTSGPVGGQVPLSPAQSTQPASTGGSAPPAASPTTAGPGANRFLGQRDAGMRRHVNNRPPASARSSSNTTPPQPAVTPSDENENARTAPNGAPANTAVQSQPNSAEPTGGATPAQTDPAKAAAEEQMLREQIAQAKNRKQPQLDGLSDDTRNDLMTQLGGHRNMDYEGTHQADEASKDMAKQSDRWGKEV